MEMRVKARLKHLWTMLAESFWAVPALMTLAAVLLAWLMVWLDASGTIPRYWLEDAWVYNGGATGARTLLGAVASSAIGVAGTVFSIMIAALSLAAGQMGPRLLRNFTRDRGNQMALGVFLGTFSYALMVLRTVRTESEGAFVPHLALTIGIALAFLCVATLVYFVSHMASRINVDTVIGLVGADVRSAIAQLTVEEPQPLPPTAEFWEGAVPVADLREGYLQELDQAGLAAWAIEHGAAMRLLVKPGDHVFPGAPIAMIKPRVEGAADAIRDATALAQARGSNASVELAVRQLVEVGVRALSSGINDPHTAISVLDRLGAALCNLAPRHLPTGVVVTEGRIALVVPAIQYAELADVMFNMIRQNAAGAPSVLCHLLHVLTAVASVEGDRERIDTLERHANLVLTDAQRNLSGASDLEDIRAAHRGFAAMRRYGPSAHPGIDAAA
ncbi:DUF2254 domain-containing protein [Paracidovorax citrulli]